MIGIYKITSPSGKIYIGQSIDIKKRLDKYRRLDMSIRGQIRLYRSLLKNGYNNHKIEVICECLAIELNEKERFYQDLYDVIGLNGLNCLLTKTSEKKRVMHPDSIEKQRLKMIGKKCHLGKRHTQETKDKMSKALIGNKYNLGRKQHPDVVNRRVIANSKIVLDLSNGVYYGSPLEYAKLNNINYNTLTCRLSGKLTNNTNLIYAK